MAGRRLPAHAPVVVIGGGVMGCSTLYHLARLGAGDAILLERNKLTSGTTWHSAAQVRALRSSRNLTELIKRSIALYSELEAETGQSTGWARTGSLSIATNPDRLAHIRRQEALAQAFGLRARSVSPGEARELWPLMDASDIIGAVWSPDDGRVGPSDLCAALAKGARARGARVFEDAPVAAILTAGGRVRGVEAGGELVRCDAAVVCAGLWSRRVAALGGAAAPVWPCEHFYLLTRPVEGIGGRLPTLSDHDGHLYIRDEAGGLLVGCFEPGARPIDPDRLGEDFAFRLLAEDWDHFEPMARNALRRVPALERAEARMLLNGPESFTPDGMFLLGESAATRGLFLGCGMNSFGVASGGGAGMALARRVVEGSLPFDLREADPNRFAPEFSSAAALAARAPEVLGKHYEIGYPDREYASARNLKRLPAHGRWAAAGAVFGQAHGWERPLYFGGPPARPAFGRPGWFERAGAEVRAAHGAAAVFEQSALGKVRVEGPDAEALLDRVCANDMARPPGRAVYTALLNRNGGFVEDAVALRLSETRYRLFVGSGAVATVAARLRRHRREGERAEVSDETADWAVFALAGPEAARIAAALGAGAFAALRPFRHCEGEIAGVPARALRFTYVGAPGWEIACAARDADRLCRALLAAGAVPAGAHAQASMRIEKRFLAMGRELDADTTPVEAGLEATVAWAGDFVGREALLRRRDAGPRGRIATLVLEDGEAAPFGGEPVRLDGAIVGRTTSAAYGWRVGAPAALAWIEGPAAKALAAGEGVRVEVDIARELHAARASLGPAWP